MPEAETPELLPAEAVSEAAAPARTIEDAFDGRLPVREILDAESVPIAEGNEPVPAHVPAPTPEPASEPERAPEPPASVHYNVPPPHDVTGPVATPRRGWWRR